MRSQIYLLLAVGAEMIGTTSVKLAATHAPVAGMLPIYGATGLSYFPLALAVKRISIGVAYVLWEGIDTVLVTAVSVAWLDESIDLYKAIGLGVMITGIPLIRPGTRNTNGTPAQPRGEAVAC